MIPTDSDGSDSLPRRSFPAGTRAASGWALARLTALYTIALPCALYAQTVSLRIGPPVGETLRMRLDQRVEMTGTTRVQGGDSTAAVVTTLLVISRAFVERRDQEATIVVAYTDSAAASSTGADSAIIAAETRRALQGKRVRLRIAPDGATEIVDRDPGDPNLNALFAQMPATLPSGEVEVGESWSRAMVAPLADAPAGGGKLEATFRLDSLSRDRETAYVSLVGTLSRPPRAKRGAGPTITMSGSMTGALVMDRRLGWVTEARTAYVVRSVVTPPPGSSSAALRFRMKVTQWMRAVR